MEAAVDVLVEEKVGDLVFVLLTTGLLTCTNLFLVSERFANIDGLE